MVVTDLDGTLLRSDRTAGEANLAALERLGRHGVLRVIATGRSLYSARLALPPSFPIDYLIFSTGAGIVDWPKQTLIRSRSLDAPEIGAAVDAVQQLGLGYMVHAPVPENHHFIYRASRRSADEPVSTQSANAPTAHADFVARVSRYQDYATPWVDEPVPETASQLLAIADASDDNSLSALRSALPHLQIVRATSPLDGCSRWLEIFPPGVNKSTAADWLRERQSISWERTVAVGNDYNDEDLLGWGAASYVVANAPEELLKVHKNVPSNDDDGFAAAINDWLDTKNP